MCVLETIFNFCAKSECTCVCWRHAFDFCAKSERVFICVGDKRKGRDMYRYGHSKCRWAQVTVTCADMAIEVGSSHSDLCRYGHSKCRLAQVTDLYRYGQSKYRWAKVTGRIQLGSKEKTLDHPLLKQF